MNERPTPETDAEHAQFAMGGFTLDFCRKLERERDEAREEAGHWKTEYEIVVDRLRGRKHPRDNGIIADDEIIPKLERERDEAREALMKIEEIFIDGEDTYEDWKKMGNIATDYLEGL